MLWLELLCPLLYVAIGGVTGIPVARLTYEHDRRRWPSLAANDVREGMIEALVIYISMLVAWPVVLVCIGVRVSAAAMITRVILPQIGEHDRQRARERQEQHIRELEQSVLWKRGR